MKSTISPEEWAKYFEEEKARAERERVANLWAVVEDLADQYHEDVSGLAIQALAKAILDLKNNR